MDTHVIILAAGQGSRMKSRLPKVLHPVAGKPMLAHVIDRARSLDAAGIHVVIGHGAEQVKTALTADDITWAVQEEQLGTGHAVAQALPGIPEGSRVLILYGDVPLTEKETLSNLLTHVNDNTLGLLTVELNDSSGYGRIVRDGSGFVTGIVEQKDASVEQLKISEVNTGIMAVTVARLRDWLPKLSNKNAQGEYYLTDIVAMAVKQGLEVAVAHPSCEEEVQGANNRSQLAHLERWYQIQLAEELMAEGASIVDPKRVDIRGHVNTGQDVIIDINTVFEGRVSLGDGAYIGPNCVLKDCVIGCDSRIEANSIIDDAVIGEKVTVGPFARIRPGTELANGAKVGNFVETKKAKVGEGSKINHLSYVGDAELGKNVNIGAGTITCNYDGVNKFKTTIEDGVFIGSNSALVAPVTIAEDATVGAGSTITKDVDEKQLAIGRGRQKNLDNWPRPKKQS